MQFELAEKLKNAGISQEPFWIGDAPVVYGGSWYYIPVPDGCPQVVFADLDAYRKGIERGDKLIKIPTLSELIDMCGDGFYILEKMGEGFMARGNIRNDVLGKTPEESVANLYLEINKDGKG